MPYDIHLGALESGKRFCLPPDLVTQTLSILGVRGSGKTHTSAVAVEELVAAGRPCIVLDPLDVWWGLRASAAGRKGGLPLVIFGGVKADLPLHASDGVLIADAVVDHDLSAVLSLRHLSNADQRRFVADFAERLYDRKGAQEHRSPLHLVIDEADAFVPQHLFKGFERCFGAVDCLVRRGRSSGFGVTLISQRPARISKDVLSQTSVLVCHRVIGPQDRKALDAWIEAHDTAGRREEFLGSLASLPIGTAWFWSPGWLDIFERVEVRRRTTFDSSSTPKIGERPKSPARLAPVDLDDLKSKLGKIVENAKANDPAELKRRIAALEKDLRSRKPISVPSVPSVSSVDIPSLLAKRDERWRRFLTARTERTRELIASLESMLIRPLTDSLERISRGIASDPPTTTTIRNSAPSSASAPSARASFSTSAAPTSNRRPSGGQKRMLIALAQHSHGLGDRALGILAGLSSRSGTFGTYLGTLRAAGHIEGDRSGFRITQPGLAALGNFDPLPTGEDLHAYWSGQLGNGGLARMFDALCRIYPKAVTKQDLGDLAALSDRSGTFGTYLGKLRTLQLVEDTGDGLRASETLFE